MLKVFANRASAQFAKAEKDINASCTLPSNFKVSYWSKFFGENPDEQPSDIQLIDPKIYNTLESKSSVAKLLKEKKIDDVFPATYWSVDDAKKHKGEVNIWFVKPSHLSGGRGIEVISHAELEEFELPQFHLLQEGIENLALIDGKKAVGRVYVALWDKGVYLFDEGFVILHGPEYKKGSTDYTVQVDHKGYQDESGGVVLRLASDYEQTKNLVSKSEKPLRKILPILEEALAATEPNRYILLGIDVIPLDDGGLKFIEINAIPNFNHNAHLNTNLNTPFFTEVIKGMIGVGSRRFTQITQSAVKDKARNVIGKGGMG